MTGCLAYSGPQNYNTDLHLGQFPNPLQSFSMGAGHATPKVAYYIRSFPWPTRVSHTVTTNPSSACVWSDRQCPWEREGVWRWSDAKNQGMAMQEDYFAKDRKGRKIEFYKDFYFPFVERWEEVISRRAKGKARMAEAIPNEFCPDWPEVNRPDKFVYAPHWYVRPRPRNPLSIDPGMISTPCSESNSDSCPSTYRVYLE